MAADQPNFGLFTYEDNSTQLWNKRGKIDTARNAVDGSTASGGHPNWGRSTRRHSPRSITYVDLTTFRKQDVIMYTAAAAAAVVLGTDVLAVHVPGETATVNYTASKFNEERRGGTTATSPGLADHA